MRGDALPVVPHISALYLYNSGSNLREASGADQFGQRTGSQSFTFE
jgi:hypothetical protein